MECKTKGEETFIWSLKLGLWGIDYFLLIIIFFVHIHFQTRVSNIVFYYYYYFLFISDVRRRAKHVWCIRSNDNRTIVAASRSNCHSQKRTFLTEAAARRQVTTSLLVEEFDITDSTERKIRPLEFNEKITIVINFCS